MHVPRALVNFAIFALISLLFRQVGRWNRNHPRRQEGHENRILLPFYYPWVALGFLAAEVAVVIMWLTGAGWNVLPAAVKWGLLVLAPVVVPASCWMLWIYRRYYLEITPEWLETVSMRGKPLHIDYANIVSVQPIRSGSGAQLSITDRFGQRTQISTSYSDTSHLQHWLATADRLGRAPTRAEL